ncbi:MAG: aldehyde dehydrogenase family protein, partial [Henriciella sp.]|nr:aldehyde dehydrogenase family protein [Henriciella sp.]
VNKIMFISPEEQNAADSAISEAENAFADMALVEDEAISRFFNHAENLLSQDELWDQICASNQIDVERALARGRTVGRLKVDESAREKMIKGLRKWKQLGVFRNSTLETVKRHKFSVDLIQAPLGVIGFVFEGRPNVVVDACGVLLSGNTVVFRIGSDAIGTAKTIIEKVVDPALELAGLPIGAISIVDNTGHGSGWALFSDPRLGLAVARGSGEAVQTLGAIARQSGVPVSLHGRGGAWMFVDRDAKHEDIAQTIYRSLDRKVCNTLNTLCILRSELETTIEAIREAAELITQDLPKGLSIRVRRNDEAHLAALDSCASISRSDLGDSDLGIEWEWDDQPEITIAVLDSLDEGYQLFNEFSPRFVASLISNDPKQHQEMFVQLDCPFVGDDLTRWVDGQFALGKPELGLSNWENGRLFGRSGILAGDSVYTVRMRYSSHRKSD